MSPNTELKLYVNDHPVPQKPPFFTREGVDLLNSMTWLSMDAMWLFGLPKVGLIFGIPSILTGFLMLYVERHRPVNYVFLSTNCWIWMNVSWMFSDTYPQYEHLALTVAKFFLSLGLVFVGMGAIQSGGFYKTLTHYKGYRLFKLTKTKKINPVD